MVCAAPLDTRGACGGSRAQRLTRSEPRPTILGTRPAGYCHPATPGRYVRQVATYQLLGWACRIGGAYFFLDAFHVEATLRNALLVQAASSLSTLVPATPGGLGPRQALLIVLLAGAASPGTVLAFGVGMELALTLWNVLIGFTFLTLMMRGTGVLTVLRSARATRDARPI